MCGIFGYVNTCDPIQKVIKGLKHLEYRGYDSSGIAGLFNGKLECVKAVGKVEELEKAIEERQLKLDIAIGHTRWATHGKPAKKNAHPHLDESRSLAVVHNGIIENHHELREMLEKEGVKFLSETDTEVIAHLISHFYNGDLIEALKKAIPLLHGSFAIGCIHKDYPGTLIGIAKDSPLVVGVGKGESFLSSDSQAFSEYTKEVFYLSDGEIAVIQKDKIEIYSSTLEIIKKETEILSDSVNIITKEGYAHYTLKEIFDQPQALKNCLLSRFSEEWGSAIFEELPFDPKEFLSINNILIVACGTSWHAGILGHYLLEGLARIPARVEFSSELRYQNPIVPKGTLVIAISQSGETADTIAAVREMKSKGAMILALCNVYSSTLTRIADGTIFLRAGPEIGVCSTKAFVNQVAVITLLSTMFARLHHMSKEKGRRIFEEIQKLPEMIQQVLDQSEQIQKLAEKYNAYNNFFYIGRRYMYPTALEGALKLKEIAYVNANGYAAGEMKHGPIALINEDCPTIAFCADESTYEKMVSNILEIKSRNGKVIAIAPFHSPRIESIADDVIYVPKTLDELSAIPSTVAAQLFAYYFALKRGTEIDQPRNLAKSVTVE